MTGFSRRQFLASAAALAAAPAVSSLCRAGDAMDPYADGVLRDGEPSLPADGAFTVVVLPDTQNYSEKYPETYAAQTRWVAESREKRNISCVLHLGDVTNHNAPAEWTNAAAAMATLADAGVPYFMVPGNHDYSERGGCKDRTTLMNEFFPVARFADLPTFGGVYDKEPDRVENSFHLFSAAGRDFLVLGLEFGPRKDVVRWANEVASKHRDREAILITHAYMYYDDTRYDWKAHGDEQTWNPHAYAVAEATGGDVTDDQELWDGLVAKHENFVMTLNGHVLKDGLGRITTQTPGRPRRPPDARQLPNAAERRRRLAAAAGVPPGRPSRSLRLLADPRAAERVAAEPVLARPRADPRLTAGRRTTLPDALHRSDSEHDMPRQTASGPVCRFIKHHYRHFNAAALLDAAEGYVAHLDAGGRMMMCLAGAMSTAELGLSLAG